MISFYYECVKSMKDSNIKQELGELDEIHAISMEIFECTKYRCANYVEKNHRCPKSKENKCHHGDGNGDEDG